MATATLPTKPVIEIKNLKHFAAGSQETHCYTATIYVDGKRFCTAGNSGHGGCDSYTPIAGTYAKIRELEERIAATYPKWGSQFNPEKGDTMDMTLEIVVGDLINDALLDKEVKKTLRRVSYIKDGEIYQMQAKYKPTEQLLKDLKEKAPWAKGVTFLNELTFEEAKAAIKAIGH